MQLEEQFQMTSKRSMENSTGVCILLQHQGLKKHILPANHREDLNLQRSLQELTMMPSKPFSEWVKINIFLQASYVRFFDREMASDMGLSKKLFKA